MNWRPMVRTGTDPKWYGNALVFATKQEAEDSAIELSMRWLAVVDTRAEETDEPVNYTCTGGRNVAV